MNEENKGIYEKTAKLDQERYFREKKQFDESGEYIPEGTNSEKLQSHVDDQKS